MEEKSEASTKLKALRERAGISVRGMAGHADMNVGRYRHYEDRFKKDYLPLDVAEIFANILQKNGIARDEVMALAGVEDGASGPVWVDSGDKAPDGTEMVPLYDVSASAGHGSVVADEDRIAHIAFNPDYLREVINASKSHLQVIKVQGESMQPTLSDGDLIMIDRSKTDLNYDGLFVLRFGDSLQVKRVGRSPAPGSVEVISDNPAYGRRDWPTSSIDALGRVIWVGKRV